MSEALFFGKCNNDQSIFMLLTWVNGKSLDKAIETLTKEQLHALPIHPSHLEKVKNKKEMMLQRLQDRTINNDHIPISLNQRKYHKGFELNIGTSVIAKGIRETYEMWSIQLDITALKNTLPTVSSPNICCLHYLPFSCRQHDYSLEYFIERETHFNTIINLQYNELIHKATVLPLSLDIDISKSFHLCPGDSFKKIYFGIYHAIVNQYPILNLATLSNYAKYMKSSHISLIKLAQKGILNQDVCTCILWNRDVLGYDDYLHVTSRLEQFEGSINNSVFYKYLLYEWAMYKVTKSKMPLNVFLSLLQTILIKILVAQYKTYYQLSPSLINISNKKQITLSVKTLAPMPLIVSYYHAQTKAYYILDCDYL